MTLQQIKDKIRSYQFIPEELKSILEVIIDYFTSVTSGIYAEIGLLQEPQEYLLMKDSGNRTWKVKISTTGVLSTENAEDGTMLLATDPAVIEKSIPFVIEITQALDNTGQRITGDQTVTIETTNSNEGDNGLIIETDHVFVDGACDITIALYYSSEQTLTVKIGSQGELCEGTIDVDVIQTGQMNVYSSASGVLAGEPIPGLIINRAYDGDGELINGSLFVQISSDDVTEGADGILAERGVIFENGEFYDGFGSVELNNAGEQVLTFKISEDDTYEAFISEGTLTITVL